MLVCACVVDLARQGRLSQPGIQPASRSARLGLGSKAVRIVTAITNMAGQLTR